MISALWNRLDPGFIDPIWLLLGLVALVAVLLLEIGSVRRRTRALRLFLAPHLAATLTASVSPHRRLLKQLLLLAAIALLFVAMARPYLFFDWTDETRSGFDVLMAVDCSKSMLTQDVKPSRLERAKLALSDFSDRLPDNRLGLIAFAGDAFLQCPLTLDHDAFQSAVRELDTNIIPRPGTDIATAINLAVQALSSQPNNLKILVLVTDGEDLEARGIAAAQKAAQAGLKIYTVGVGTPNGDVIPETDDNSNTVYHRDADGQIVHSQLDENTLRQIASATGGAYLPLGQRGEGLQEIYDRYIAPLPRQNLEERREKIHLERFEWPLSLAILFLLLEFMITERAATPTPTPNRTPQRPIRRRPSVVAARRDESLPSGGAAASQKIVSLTLLTFLFIGLLAPARASNLDTAERDYQSGQYQDALENYRAAADQQPDRPDLQYDLGDAAYKAGEYLQAEDAFHKALATPDLGLQEKTYYNLGNAQFKHGEALQSADNKKTIDLWQKALDSYASALKLKPSADAKHNYEVVKEKLEELKQQQQQQQQQGQKSPSSGSNSNPSSGQDSSQSQGQGNDQQPSSPNQPGQDNSQNGQGSSPSQNQPQPQSGDKPDQNQSSSSADKNGQDAQPSGSKDQDSTQNRAYSGTRPIDQQDPVIKSREEAEALLDSLKDDERHVTARSLNGNNENPPPPPSGKDW